MASEITISMTIACINGDYNYRRSLSGEQFDQAAQGASSGIQEIGFGGHEAIEVADLGTEGWLFMRNLDDTNFVDFGIEVAAAFEPVGRMEPGEPAMFRLSKDAGATLFAQADTAACNVEYMILED